MRFVFLVFTVLLALMSISEETRASSDKLKFETGIDFLNSCSLENEFSNHLLYCAGYIGGFLDAMVLAHNELDFCLRGEGISAQQTIMIFNKYAKEHPEDLDLPGRFVLGLALAEAYPCE